MYLQGLSKCTTVDCEDYAYISGGRDGSLTSEFRHQRRVTRFDRIKDILISVRSKYSYSYRGGIDQVSPDGADGGIFFELKGSKKVILPALDYNYI